MIAFFILCSISAASATNSTSNSGANNGLFTDVNDNYVILSSNQKVFTIEKNKIPKKWKSYENKTFQVPTGKKIKYKASVNSNGFLIYNLEGIKIKSAIIDFGDGTKKKTTNWVSHTYKRSGYYLIKVTILNATFDKSKSIVTDNGRGNGTITNLTREYLVKATYAPQLSVGKITAGYYNYNNYKKGNINYLDIKVSNIGSKYSKKTLISMWYQKKGDNNFGKVNPKLKKYTKSAKLKALAPGKSAIVRLYFSIPKKYSKLAKNLRLGSKSLTQISKRDALYNLN